MKEIELAIQKVASVVRTWAPQNWVSLHFTTPIYKDNCGGMVLEATKKDGGVAQLSFDWDGIDALVECCLQIRDLLLRTTGKRIWGLTYTLLPDGKFNVDYDYNKPDEYDLADEQAPPLGVAQAFNDLAATGIAIERTDATALTPEQQFLAQALAQLQAQTASHSANWGLGSETQWNLDMAAGTLRFTFADGRVLLAPVQVVGTYNTKDSSFLWGWDHPSVPLPLRRAAQRVLDYGTAHGIGGFTTRSLECTQDQAWELTAAAAQLDGAAGAYRGDANGTWVYMVFAPPEAG